MEAGLDYYKIVFTFSSLKGGVNGGVKLTPKQEEVLNLIVVNPFISFEKAAEQMHINISAVRKHFDKLKEKKAIIRKGGAKGGYWEDVDK